MDRITAIVIADSGCEEACAKEIEGIAKAKPDVHANALRLECALIDACRIAYLSKVARRVLVEIALPLAPGEPIASREPLHAGALFPQGCTFKAEAEVLALSPEGERADGQDASARETPSAQELTEEIGGWAHRALGLKVSLSRPDLVVRATRTPERTYVGVDVMGFPLARREWRIMLSRTSLKSTVAAAVAIYSGARPGERILDPLGDDGTIAIEAALVLSGTSPHRFAKALACERFPALAGTDWRAWREGMDAKAKEIGGITVFCATLREMKAVRTNSKLAGIEKMLHSTRVAIDWLDLKLEERSVHRIITQAPQSGKATPQRKAEQEIDDLFNQSAYILRKGGTISCVAHKGDELLPAAERHGFALRERRKMLMGMHRIELMTFGKDSAAHAPPPPLRRAVKGA